ncbi:hypothetical protein F3Y22_tig00112674pilonHSYRG00023 [Hibiscus syriacus]|uniref:Uncharacterized protein n=1 Tax=Hibiscus syriacus TaxID=106335 RepID=A0A6A2WUG3_HIBSY|nr:hypothetical protein F3Y22_tig00112674pilonHSYRG00023 [Hibiscus syriacus]
MDHTDADNVKPTEECHKVHNVDESDILVGKLFSSHDQAWYFYKEFTREHGFSGRRGTTRLDMEGNVKTQEFFCSKEGAVSKADIDEATVLKEVGVGTPQLMNYLTQQVGGYHNVGFTHKDLYNALQRGKANQIVDGDVNVHIAYFDYKKHDDPRAMQRAIKSVISNAKLRLCSWHISRNAQVTLVTQNLQQHSQNAWFPGGQPTNLIFNGVELFQSSTSKSIYGCESMNASLVIALKHKKTYLDVVRAIEDGISRMHLNELKADYLSSQTKPFLITKVVEFESHASKIYTHESFRAFQEELQRETLYRIQEEIQSLSDEFGLPCRHQLHVLKHLDYTYLPGPLIQIRWTKDAKASKPSFVDLNVPPEIMQMARFASLRATASMLCYAALKTDASFKTARDEMKRLTEEFENSFGLNDSVNQSSVLNNVRDPQRK